MIKSAFIMLIWSNLPIDRHKFAQNDQILTINEANWLDYQHLDSQEYPGYRVSYFKCFMMWQKR
jgi:hypothetical protein